MVPPQSVLHTVLLFPDTLTHACTHQLFMFDVHALHAVNWGPGSSSSSSSTVSRTAVLCCAVLCWPTGWICQCTRPLLFPEKHSASGAHTVTLL
jgi:hypothetical protein